MCSSNEAVEVFWAFLCLISRLWTHHLQIRNTPTVLWASTAVWLLCLSACPCYPIIIHPYCQFCFLFYAVYRRCADLLHPITVICCSLQCMLFICAAIDKIQWIQKKKWTFLCCPTSVGYTVSKTRKKAPFGVWRWKAVVFHTDHFGSIFMLVDSCWNKWWAA